MKHSLRWRLFPGLLLCAGLVLPAASAKGPGGQQPKLLLEEATKKELVDGDLKGAIEIYQKILSLEGVPRASVARALLHLGQCYEKLGSTEARKAYERLVREFADQPEETTAARARLSALGGQDTAMRVRQVWAGPHDDLLGAPTRDGRSLTCQDWPSENLTVRDLATGQKRMLTSKAKGPSSSRCSVCRRPTASRWLTAGLRGRLLTCESWEWTDRTSVCCMPVAS
jgi:hypothetical protein